MPLASGALLAIYIGQVFYSNYIGLNGSEAQVVQHSDETDCIGATGCTETSACNYDPAAECPDGSCEYESCLGCMYPMACNYKNLVRFLVL
jgi:hypothetical protein